MDIESPIEVRSSIEVGSPVDIRCYSTSLYILVLGRILILGLKLGLKL
jgi:hypothetical protein